ncbi:hypothetical protein ACOMHN_030961 [Nucella lapillus]
MATPLVGTQILTRKQKYCYSLQAFYRRFFASKRKQVQTDGQQKKVHVKSLFKAQTDEGQTAARSYRAMMDERREQACRSVLVRVPAASPDSVCDSLQAMGAIHRAFSLQHGKDYLLVEFERRQTVEKMLQHDYLLVEFERRQTVEKLLQHVSYFPDTCQLPIQSRLLYAMNNGQVQRHRPGKPVVPETVVSTELTAEDYIAADSVSDQMKALHNTRHLSDIGSRLRFFVCSLVEDLIRTSMPFCLLEPFGSSSNGFGWDGCDLDMMVNLSPPESRSAAKRFRFLTKRGSDEERVFGQQCLDVMGEMIRGLMPSTRSVNKVLNARVPIVKFNHEATGLDCDLTYVNLSGSKMSELMFLLGEADLRVRVLLTTVKQWARSCDLTRTHPGPWPSSFTLLGMLVFFLQTRSPPVLPALRAMQGLAEPEDHFIIDDVDYAFVTDVSKVPRSSNTQSLDDLLMEFFHFFAHFDFSSQGLSLIEGGAFPRQGPSCMHMENPLDVAHNVSVNISPAHLARLQAAMLDALRCLEVKGRPDGSEPWGLFCLFQPSSHAPVSPTYSVAGLFEGSEGSVEQESDGESGEGNAADRESMSDSMSDSKSVVELGKGGVTEKGSAIS